MTKSILGLSNIGNISLGTALVIGKNLVPKPAAGIIALLIFFIFPTLYFYYTLIENKNQYATLQYLVFTFQEKRIIINLSTIIFTMEMENE